MTKVFDILPKPMKNQEAFILDHGKTENGILKYKDDLTSYGWNVKRFKKLHVGAFVLNRKPGKLNKDRKFEIYSGGVVTHISTPDKEGNVVATIGNVFKIVPPIRQGEDFIENFEWESKNKKPNSWEHFWNQYGMNTISFSDFTRLVADVNCVPINDDFIPEEKDISEDELKELVDKEKKGFKVYLENEGRKRKKTVNKFTGIAKKIDFDRINKSKSRVGALGEQIVFDFLKRKAEEEGLIKPVHASKEEGDGLGYDIRYWDKESNEIHVEVKTTTNNYTDGFEMTQNEIFASQNPNYKYEIYRIYNLSASKHECNLAVYEGPINDERFVLETKKVIVYQK